MLCQKREEIILIFELVYRHKSEESSVRRHLQSDHSSRDAPSRERSAWCFLHRTKFLFVHGSVRKACLNWVIHSSVSGSIPCMRFPISWNRGKSTIWELFRIPEVRLREAIMFFHPQVFFTSQYLFGTSRIFQRCKLDSPAAGAPNFSEGLSRSLSGATSNFESFLLFWW